MFLLESQQPSPRLLQNQIADRNRKHIQLVNVVVFVNSLGIGGTEKAACRWAWGLKERGHNINVLTLKEGPRRAELESHDIPIILLPTEPSAVAEALAFTKPDVIHAHAPGFLHEGDILGRALARLARIPLVQTNIFGRLENPAEGAWTDFRLFISWTSCVQAARRACIRLDRSFFEHASVASYPLDPDDGPSITEVIAFRQKHGISASDVLFSRLSRPDPSKWTSLSLDAFRLAVQYNQNLKLLLREPPPSVAAGLRSAPDADRFCILPATSDAVELRHTMGSLDVVLHTSNIGESFGYGIAEPMNYGKPVITNCVPWHDQTQIELVRHRECGLLASTPQTMSEAILTLADDPSLRARMGEAAQRHIRRVTDPVASFDRLETALNTVINRRANPHSNEDLARAKEAAEYLDAHQFGHGWREQLALRPFYYRVRFHQWRKALRRRFNRIRPPRFNPVTSEAFPCSDIRGQ
jgi:glycosyltransferase involved in cell wall biosynthesis